MKEEMKEEQPGAQWALQGLYVQGLQYDQDQGIFTLDVGPAPTQPPIVSFVFREACDLNVCGLEWAGPNCPQIKGLNIIGARTRIDGQRLRCFELSCAATKGTVAVWATGYAVVKYTPAA